MFDEEREQSPRRNGKPWLFLAILIATLIGLALSPLGPWHLWQRPSSESPTQATNLATGEPVDSTTILKEGQPDPPIYWQTIEENIAQGLHLSVPQVKENLQPPAGQRDSLGIGRVASQQGISEDQLRIIEINAIQKGHDLLVQQGILTQQGSDLGMQRIQNWDQTTLDDHVTGWFLNN